MLTPGEIVLRWDAQGHLTIAAPVGDREVCCLMLCEAQRAILNHFPGLLLPNPQKPELRNKN